MPTFEEIDAAKGWNSIYNPTGASTTTTAPPLSTTVSQPVSSSTTPWASNTTATSGQTAFPDVNMNTGGLLNPSTTNTPYKPTTTLLGNQPYVAPGSSTTSGSVLDQLTYGTLPAKPVAPSSPAAPTYANTLGNMYTDTFTNPNSMWDEYSQGQGVNFTQGAARAMAKAGRTGMLPTLNTMAHQDYMSNYLPSVRKDLAPGLSYENTANQNLTQKYGQDQDFASKNYSTDASMYGQGLTYASNMAQVAAQVKDIGVKEKLGMLDADLKMYGIDNDTIQQIYATMGNIFPKMTAQDQAAMVNELQLALSINKAGNVALADTTNPVGTTPTTTAPTTNALTDWSTTYGG
jgi:hypothetical protein